MNEFDPLRKLLHVDEAVARFAGLPATVFTDAPPAPLGRAAIAYLAEARRLGARLVVGIHADIAADEAAAAHAYQLAALESVDAVVQLATPGVAALLARLHPAVCAMAGPHDLARSPEAALMRAWDGRAIALPLMTHGTAAPRPAALELHPAEAA